MNNCDVAGSVSPDRLEHPKRSTHLSVMATCSNMADPVLLFQLPEMDVRLQKKRKLCIKLVQTQAFTLGVFSTVNLRQTVVDEVLRRSWLRKS